MNVTPCDYCKGRDSSVRAVRLLAAGDLSQGESFSGLLAAAPSDSSTIAERSLSMLEAGQMLSANDQSEKEDEHAAESTAAHKPQPKLAALAPQAADKAA